MNKKNHDLNAPLRYCVINMLWKLSLFIVISVHFNLSSNPRWGPEYYKEI